MSFTRESHLYGGNAIAESDEEWPEDNFEYHIPDLSDEVTFYGQAPYQWVRYPHVAETHAGEVDTTQHSHRQCQRC